MKRRYPNETIVRCLRAEYPVGSRIECISMVDPWSKIKPGDQGTVRIIDDIGTIHVNWDCGSSLGLVYGEDSYRKV